MHELSSAGKIVAASPDACCESALLAEARKRMVSYGRALVRRC